MSNQAHTNPTWFLNTYSSMTGPLPIATPARNTRSDISRKKIPDSDPVLVSMEITNIPDDFDSNPDSTWHADQYLPCNTVTVCFANTIPGEGKPAMAILKHLVRNERRQELVLKFSLFLRPYSEGVRYDSILNS